MLICWLSSNLVYDFQHPRLSWQNCFYARHYEKIIVDTKLSAYILPCLNLSIILHFEKNKMMLDQIKFSS